MPSSRRARWLSPIQSFAAPKTLHRAHLALVAGALFAAAVLTLAGTSLWIARGDEMAKAESDLVNLGHMLAEQLAQRIETIDLGLKVALGQVQESGQAGDKPGHDNRVLHMHAEMLAAVSAIGLYGSGGEQLAASTPDATVLPASLAESEAIAAHRAERHSGLHISLPFRTSERSPWLLTLSRRVSDQHGEYRGIIVAVVEPRKLADTYRSLDLGPQTFLAFLKLNGTILAAQPWRDDLLGRALPQLSPAVAPEMEHKGEVQRLAGILDAQPVLAYTTTLRGFAVALSVVTVERAVLAPWRRHAIVGGTAATVIAILALALGSLLDRHLRRRDESVAQLRENQAAVQHLASVVESTEDAIFSVSSEGRILSWNRGAARTFGHSAADSIGRSLSDLLPAAEAEQAQRLITRSVGGETIENLEIQLTAKGNRRIHVAVTLAPLRDATGRISAASAVARDITSRHEDEERRHMEHRVAQILAESASPAQTLPRIVERLCQSLAMDCGIQWEPDPDDTRYRRTYLWCRPDIDPAALASKLASELPAGGACEWIWQLTLPQWLTGDELAACGMLPDADSSSGVSALFLPITLGSRVVCAFDLRTHEVHAHGGALLASARAIGSQIGQYLERRRAEDDLRAEKEYIAHVIATAPTLIASIAPDGTTRSINPTIRHIAGYLPEELQARNFWHVLHGGASGEVEHLLAEVAKGGVADYHLTMRTRDGVLRDLSVSAAARRAGDGSIVEYIVVGTDVTARHLDEARRAAEYAVVRALSEEQSEHDAVERILGTVCEMLGWECGVYRISDPVTKLVSCLCAWSKPEPEMRALAATLSEARYLEADTLYWRTVDSGFPQWANDLPQRVGPRLRPRVERAQVRSALSVPIVAAERFLGVLQFFGRSTNRPESVLLEAMQAVGHQVGQFIERKRVEAERHQADERLRNIAANIPGIVFEYRLRPDQSGAFEFVSERALDMLEESPEHLTGNPRLMFRLVDPAFRRQVLRSMHVSRHTRSLWLSEMPIRTQSGRVRWVRGQSMPKYLDDGSVVWDGVIVDVTAQKQAEHAIQQMNEQLERRVADRTAQLSVANRELESFAYSVSHDLRAPLRSIQGFSRILAEEYGRTFDPTAANYLARVRNAAERMGQLIDDLLSLSRVTRSELKRVRTDLSAIAAAVVLELRAESPERSVSVSIHPGMSCFADPSLIRIALYNLIGNAWKFTSKRAGASIEFGALTQRNKTVYYIRDNGAGFDMEHAGKLFGAFQRLHSPREFEGTGVGLATVSRIVDRHGGTVWAESTVDQGATFYFTLGSGGPRP